MKIGQSNIVRWVAKLVSKAGRTDAQKSTRRIQTLGTDQLRQVSGGTGTSTDGPNKGW